MLGTTGANIVVDGRAKTRFPFLHTLQNCKTNKYFCVQVHPKPIREVCQRDSTRHRINMPVSIALWVVNVISFQLMFVWNQRVAQQSLGTIDSEFYLSHDINPRVMSTHMRARVKHRAHTTRVSER